MSPPTTLAGTRVTYCDHSNPQLPSTRRNIEILSLYFVGTPTYADITVTLLERQLELIKTLDIDYYDILDHLKAIKPLFTSLGTWDRQAPLRLQEANPWYFFGFEPIEIRETAWQSSPKESTR